MGTYKHKNLEELKQFRNQVGLSQEKMAQRMGISFSMYHKVETGQAKASRGFMERLKAEFPYASIDAIFFPVKDKRGTKQQ